MKKARLIEQILGGLRENLDTIEKAARSSHAEATHESSKAENKYDTRGLEAAYLAGAQAKQAREVMEALKAYESLAPRDFATTDAIDLAALVELEVDGARSFYFIGPKGGGLEIQHQRKEVTVITPQSPLGQNLMGKKAGEKWLTKMGKSNSKFLIVSVS